MKYLPHLLIGMLGGLATWLVIQFFERRRRAREREDMRREMRNYKG